MISYNIVYASVSTLSAISSFGWALSGASRRVRSSDGLARARPSRDCEPLLVWPTILRVCPCYCEPLGNLARAKTPKGPLPLGGTSELRSELELSRRRKEKLATPHENPKQPKRIHRTPCVRKAFCADASWLLRVYYCCVQRTRISRVAFTVVFSATCLHT